MHFDESDPQQALILELRKSNGERIQTLQQRGIQVQIGGRTEGILELLLDAVLGDSDTRMQWERDQAEAVANVLDQMEEQIRNQMLTQGVGMDPRVVQQIHRNGGLA